MSDLDRPIHTATINGAPVRFFRAPSSDPHLPWHSVDDLYQALKLSGPLRNQMLERTTAFPHAGVKRIPTADGQVVIASHSMAQWLIGAAIEAKGATLEFEREYNRASAEATNALSGELSAMESLMLTITAARNTLRDGS